MRIIIDGNDGVGKSTLAKKLQKDLGIKSYIHLSGDDPRDYTFYRQILRKRNVIFDRSFLDERIYSEVLGREPLISESEELALINYVKSSGIYVIICTSPEHIYKGDEFEEIVKQKELINSRFKQLVKEHNFTKFNTRTDDYKKLVESIKQFFQKA